MYNVCLTCVSVWIRIKGKTTDCVWSVPHCELGILCFSESSRCHISCKGCWERDYFRTTVYFPAHLVILFAMTLSVGNAFCLSRIVYTKLHLNVSLCWVISSTWQWCYAEQEWKLHRSMGLYQIAVHCWTHQVAFGQWDIWHCQLYLHFLKFHINAQKLIPAMGVFGIFSCLCYKV